MPRRGRPGLGPKHAAELDGSEMAKTRLEILLETLSGERTVADAAEVLGVAASHIHRLRDRALQGAVEALEPKPAGRPAAPVDPRDERIAELERLLERKEIEVEAAWLRAEIALLMPHLLTENARALANKKKRQRRARRARKKKR